MSFAPKIYASDTLLGPGMPAPELKVGKWLKGQPVKKLSKGIYVVEFWATWCVPCKVNMPHLSALAKKNPNVTFVGVSIWERKTTKPAEIQKFVDDMGDKMAYNVATDSNAFMDNKWMKPAKQIGIPTSFLIKDGIIQWIGDPTGLAKPMAEVLAGTFNLESSKKKFNTEAAEYDAQQLTRRKIEELNALLDKKKGKEALAVADKHLAAHPKDAMFLGQFRTAALALVDTTKAKAQMDKAIAEKDYWQVAGAAAILKKNNEAAAYGVDRLVNGDGIKDPMVCFLVASYYITSKNKPMALKVVALGRKALVDLKMNEPDMVTNLDRLQKEAEAIK